ncbi:hypothetical protein ACFWZ2_01985 [Streptomyces sp. NPDC059002]|uniref:hypothetical protein n=1 Tax=Streptomyces sp. NPDC059002 TaxID=3346690 RepID=UPI00367D90D8
MRRSAALALMAASLLGAFAAPAAAVPDPVGTVTCVTEAAGDITALVDPASPGVPSELPGAACLAP